MRIVLIGQAAFAEEVLQALSKRGEEVIGVYMPPDVPGKANPLKELATKLGIPSFQPKKMRDPQVFTEYKELKPDLNILAFVTDILPENILKYPKRGSIQYHPSLLPKHRGGSAINWAIINGDAKTGLTIFWPDKGIDTGPILLQKEVEILPDDTVGSIYFNKLFPLGVEAISESLELIKQGKAPRIQQDESQATYEGLCTEKEAIIDWSQPATNVYNLIRGTNPQPGATTFFKGKKLKIFDSVQTSHVVGSPGEIVDISKPGITIACAGGAILVKRVQPAGGPKIASSELAEQWGMKAGERVRR